MVVIAGDMCPQPTKSKSAEGWQVGNLLLPYIHIYMRQCTYRGRKWRSSTITRSKKPRHYIITKRRNETTKPSSVSLCSACFFHLLAEHSTVFTVMLIMYHIFIPYGVNTSQGRSFQHHQSTTTTTRTDQIIHSFQQVLRFHATLIDWTEWWLLLWAIYLSRLSGWGH